MTTKQLNIFIQIRYFKNKIIWYTVEYNKWFVIRSKIKYLASSIEGCWSPPRALQPDVKCKVHLAGATGPGEHDSLLS